ncbi:MAG TPA: hypothetical protein VIY96_01705 [Thermoanaerobaculia bacterium]
MKRVFCLSLLLVAASIGAGCSRRHPAEHATEREAPEPPSPTPDTTPIAALRTPAGRVLGVEGTPAPPSPTPATTTTPVR